MIYATRVHRPSRVLTICTAIAMGWIDVAAQVNYVTVGPVTTPDPQAFLSVQSPNSCSDSSQTVPHRGFLKAGTSLKIDALISDTGHCDVYYGKTGVSEILCVGRD
jgi:hypothetical protein